MNERPKGKQRTAGTHTHTHQQAGVGVTVLSTHMQQRSSRWRLSKIKHTLTHIHVLQIRVGRVVYFFKLFCFTTCLVLSSHILAMMAQWYAPGWKSAFSTFLVFFFSTMKQKWNGKTQTHVEFLAHYRWLGGSKSG